MWCWGREAKDLVKYIMEQPDDMWEFEDHAARHRPSRLRIWIQNNFFHLEIWDSETTSWNSAGMSLVQKWKIHRKLNKLRQKMIKRQRTGGHSSMAEKYLAKMVEGTLVHNPYEKTK